jgi:DNA-binding response OmpR family regulator
MSTARILIVEDDPPLGNMYRMFFAALRPGYLVRVIGDGGEALDAIKKEDFNLVVTDLNIPTVEGSELYVATQKLCAQQARRMPLFVFCSGVKNALDLTTAFCRNSRNRQMLKPFPMAELAGLVDEMLGQPKQRAT